MKTTRILFVLLSVAVWAVSAQAQLPTKQVLTLDTAKKIAAAAEAEAKKRGATVVIAVALPGAVALQGGVPIIVDRKVVGAIGVSGNSPQEDEDIAKAGADSATTVIKGGSK